MEAVWEGIGWHNPTVLRSSAGVSRQTCVNGGCTNGCVSVIQRITTHLRELVDESYQLKTLEVHMNYGTLSPILLIAGALITLGSLTGFFWTMTTTGRPNADVGERWAFPLFLGQLVGVTIMAMSAAAAVVLA